MDEFLDDESKDKLKEEEKKQSKEKPKDDQNSDEQTIGDEFSEDIISNIEEIKKLLFDEKFEEAHEKYMITKELFSELRKKHLDEQNKIYSSLEQINKQMVDSLNHSRQEVQNKIAVIELGGFQNMKQTADIDFFFHTTNKMQFKNRWVYYPETNKVFLRGVHILPSYGVDKKQFQMLIKNTIKASEIFYPFIQELTQTDKEPYEVLEEFGTQNKKVIDNFNYK